jgi:hypothetical protein
VVPNATCEEQGAKSCQSKRAHGKWANKSVKIQPTGGSKHEVYPVEGLDDAPPLLFSGSELSVFKDSVEPAG